MPAIGLTVETGLPDGGGKDEGVKLKMGVWSGKEE